ncbi:septum formation initiator family protein [Paenibacillus sp. PL2-23]|uniref:FtsB family cell division protein n=1 Tax=Paenibacillus sp. PL2-23 TaxID=2100729 RepID=UPI0030F9B4AB
MATATAKQSASGSKRRYRLWMMFIILFMGWAGYTLFGQMQQQKATYQKLTAIEEGIEETRARTEELNKKVEQLNDPEYISQLATKELGMVKEGEQQIFSE